jgi:nicotinamidase-related amidase
MIDFISEWRVPDRTSLLRQVERAVPRAVRLLQGARGAGVPVIHANDNFGQWRSDFSAVWSTAVAAGDAPARIATAIAPEEADYRVLKPKHSAFFGTPLDLLLEHLGASTLVLCGVAGNQCVTATAIDAHMRDYTPVVVHDACGSRTVALHRSAMTQWKDLGLGVVAASSVHWASLKA